MRARRGRGCGHGEGEAAGREGEVKRKAMLGNGRPGVLADANASAVEVGRTVKPQDFGRRASCSSLGLVLSRPLAARRPWPVCCLAICLSRCLAVCARLAASTQPWPATRALGRALASLEQDAVLDAPGRVSAVCLPTTSFITAVPPRRPGELVLRAGCCRCLLTTEPRRKRQASSCTNAANMLTRALQRTTASSMQPRRSRYVPPV